MQPLSYYTPPRRPALPASLRVVAWLFIIFGLLCTGDMLHALATGRLKLNLGVFSILVGHGLLRLRPGWRKAAIILLVLWIAGNAGFLLFAVMSTGPLAFLLDDHAYAISDTTSRLIALGLGAPACLLGLWQYITLRRPEIRAMFDAAYNPPPPADPPPAGPRIDPLA